MREAFFFVAGLLVSSALDASPRMTVVDAAAACPPVPETLCVTPAGYIGEPVCGGGECTCTPISLEDR